eukprot:scaffold35378_cov58-Cyclotella_meneghiniana.AAC.1
MSTRALEVSGVGCLGIEYSRFYKPDWLIRCEKWREKSLFSCVCHFSFPHHLIKTTPHTLPLHGYPQFDGLLCSPEFLKRSDTVHSMDTASGGQLRPTILNEWGEKTEKFKAVDLNNDVISKLQKNDPAVTAIRATLASWGRVKHWDWGVAGRAVGASVHLKHLSLGFYSGATDIMQSFFTGLAFNRSIESLELTLNHGDGDTQRYRYDDDTIEGIDDAYTKLAPFFSENHHLVCITFDVSTEGFVSRTLAQLIQSSPSIQSAMIDCNHACTSSRGMERILQAVCRNQTLEHISAKSLPLSKDICGEIQNMLSNDNCALKSLAFEYQTIADDACVASIARGFNQNHSVERFRLTAYEDDFGNDDDWTSFFGSMQSSSFRELDLYGIIKSDS